MILCSDLHRSIASSDKECSGASDTLCEVTELDMEEIQMDEAEVGK